MSDSEETIWDPISSLGRVMPPSDFVLDSSRSSFSQTKKNWPERILRRSSTPETLTHTGMWNSFSSKLPLSQSVFARTFNGKKSWTIDSILVDLSYPELHDYEVKSRCRSAGKAIMVKLSTKQCQTSSLRSPWMRNFGVWKIPIGNHAHLNLTSTAWCSEFGSPTSLDAHASNDVREPILLHQTVCAVLL